MDKTIKKSLLGKFLYYVTFSIMGMIGLSCYILADTYFVAKALGPNGLASLNLAIAVYSLLHGIGLMLGIGGATKFIVLRAQNEEKQEKVIFSHTLAAGMAAALFFVLAGVFGSDFISRLLGADENTIGMTSIYLRTILCFAPFFITNNILIAFVRNDGNPSLSMAAMLIGSLSNIALDYLFMFPFKMGMFGAAFATGLAPVISILVLSFHFLLKKNEFGIQKCKLKLRTWRDICFLGLSSLTTELSSAVVLIVFNLLILGIAGNIGVAAYGIVANLSLVAISVFVGIGQGMQPMVSRYYGEKKAEEVKSLLRYGLLLSAALAAGIYLITYQLTDQLIAVFNGENNKLLQIYAEKGIHIYFSGFAFAGINIMIAAYLSAVEEPHKAFWVSITRACLVLVPLAVVLASLLGMTGVWLSFPCAEAITLLLVGSRARLLIKPSTI